MQLRSTSRQFSRPAYTNVDGIYASPPSKVNTIRRCCHQLGAPSLRCRSAQTSCAIKCSTTIGVGPIASSTLDIDSSYKLRPSDVHLYRTTGFVKLKNVFDDETLSYYAPEMSLAVKQADKTPLQSDPDYQQAFTQVINLRRKNKQVAKFVMGQKLARIAAELMGVEGVRLYADQALYKEPHGGYTPWHCDASYWPLATDKVVSAWIPLQATPQEMGPMQFAVGSHEHDLGRHLDIGRDNHKLIGAKVQQGGFSISSEPFQYGEVSFHSSLSFHKANGNTTDRPREAFVIIFMDQDMTLADPSNEFQHRDRNAYYPDLLPGQVCDTEQSPVIWSGRT